MWLLKAKIVLIFVFNLMQLGHGRTGLEVRTENGLFHGSVSLSRQRREFYSWRGIPYAEPPVGELRFEAPVPVRPSNGTFSAMNYGPPCSQIFVGLVPIGSEDCLTLNIFAPADVVDRQNPMPVMIFIHGGVFTILSAPYFSPEYFMDEDVILVTINYRLDVFGFLSTGDDVVRGNMGLKDQSMAIRWVRKNIDAFGGDASRITIFGESAGGVSVHYHLLSPMSRGLFNGAISQSGTALAPWSLNEHPVEQANKFGQNMGCSTNSSKVLVSCLRSKTARQILALRFRAHLFSPTDFFQKSDVFLPVIEAVKDEHAFLTEHPKRLIEQGKSANVPWLTGINSAEGLLLVVPFIFSIRLRGQLDENWDQLAADLLFESEPKSGKNWANIREFYFGRRSLNSLSVLPEMTQMVTDRLFLAGLLKSIHAHAKAAPAYAYYYTKKGPSIYKILTSVASRYPNLVELARAYARTWVDGVLNHETEAGVGHYDEMLMLSPLPSLYYVGHHHPDFGFSRDLVKLWVSFASGNNRTLSFRGVNFEPVESRGNPVLFQIDDVPHSVSLDVEKRMTLWNEFEGNVGQK